MAGLRFADIIGERVTIKVKNNGQYTNINEIKRETEGAGSANDEPDF